jgi:hypothetical protein
VCAVDRYPVGSDGAGDEALVDAGAVEVGAPDRVGDGVRPVDVGVVDRHAVGDVGAGDEVLIGAGAVEVGAPYRAFVWFAQ